MLSLSSILLLLAAGAIGGIVANIADRLGRRLGKKKLKLFGWRPRITAQILTTLSGILIAFIVVGFALFFSKGVSKWLQEGPQVLADRDHLRSEVKQLEDDRKNLEDQRNGLRVEESKLQNSQKGLRLQVGQLSAKAEENRRKLSESVGRIRDLQTRKAALEARRSQLEAAKAKVERDVASGKVKLVEVSGKLSEIDKSLSETNAMLTNSNAKLKEANDQLKDLNENNQALIRQNEQLLKDQKDAVAAKNNADAAFKIRLAEIESQIKQSNADLTTAKLAADQYEGISKFFLFAPVVFARGEEVSRVQIPPLLSRDQAESLLNDFLNQVSETAKSKGSRARDKNPIVTINTGVSADSSEPVRVEDALNAMLKQLAGAKTEQVMILTSETNAFAGQPVFGTIKISPNPVIYNAGQIVAETRINGRQSEEEIFDLVTKFIRADVNQRVRRAGMLPRTGQDSGVGEVSMIALIDLVKEIRAKDQFTRVYARANDQTRASGPLALVFQVR